MSYKIKGIYYSIQGEGFQTGIPMVLVRFTGCNLWSGLEKDRGAAVCQFCDTDFNGTDGENGGVYHSAEELINRVISLLSKTGLNRHCLLTGGEPALQIDSQLIEGFHRNKFKIAIETNGTIPLPKGIDWICVSPKAGADLMVTQAEELKVVYPQEGLDLENYLDLKFDHFYLQPKAGPHFDQHTQLVVDTCLKDPRWKLSLQIHKFIHIA